MILLGGALGEKLKEVMISVFPITVIVLLLHFTITPLPSELLGLFLIGVVLLVIGMAMFTLGADIAMLPMGEMIGNELTEARKVSLFIIFGFVIGFIVTFAEPDVKVLAGQVAGVPDLAFLATVALGAGIFLVLGLLRILLNWSMNKVLWLSYMLVFLIASFSASSFLPVAFDSGGVTTGPITVPFIVALGVGVAAVRGGKDTTGDSFGLSAIVSIGPILAVLLLGMTFDTSAEHYEVFLMPEVNSIPELLSLFYLELPRYFKEVGQVLIPLVGIFSVFQVMFLRLKTKQLIKLGVGLLYTYIGIVVFLTGVNVGFMPAGIVLGAEIAGFSSNWLLVPIGFILGLAVVAAEPAVYVLINEVEDVSGGSINARGMLLFISLGVGISVSLSMVRVLTGIDLMYFLLPGYGIALLLTLFVPNTFTAIAFDSGGVAAGTMTAAFLLPFAVGAAEAVGGNIMTDAFGLIAMVAMAPLVTIQILGIIYSAKTKRIQTTLENGETVSEADTIS